MADSDAARAWGNLQQLYGAVRRRLDQGIEGEAGCSLADHDLLTALRCSERGKLQMLDLADRLGVTRGGLTRIIDRHVDRGWVRRDRPEHNRREVYAVLTEEGGRVLEAARAVYLRVLSETLERHLDEGELAGFLECSEKLLREVAGTGCGEGGHPGISV
ncbi:MarR family winged helix-turn-helix transcriptional regulator [Amycolatopsis sp. 195334CR]|uniref:MarR family winged helix-turn-helix transcriptional regulator n=1 Tax=Amycolatopsis sp. 195334CR TaxID=2814588 RepID=UPI001A8D647F|nr:MarR family transcriptional regulator [Amycolatopsis sp. 195334CR]MBN6034949.1 MarR family transcriptional regulator [Amycolatopsis sp. 195334CR]